MNLVRSIFEDPVWLIGLGALPALIWRARVGARRRARDWERLGAWGRPTGDGSIPRLIAVICILIGLARPRWGRDPDYRPPPGHDVLIAIDVSRSMAARDAVPDRLGLGAIAARGLVQALGVDPGERVGVVAFAGRGVVRCPLTENLGAVVDALDRLRPGEVEPGGTDLGSALRAARGVLDAERPEPAEGRAIVLISDGEDHPGSWRAAIPPLRRLGVVVHAVAIGDPEVDQPIPDPKTEGGELIRDGKPVGTRRRDEALRAIAEATGGAFLPVGLAEADLGALYRDRIQPMERSRRDAARGLSGTVERFSIPLAVGLGALLFASRPPILRRRPALLIGLIALCTVAGAPTDPSGARLEVGLGNIAYRGMDMTKALDHYGRATALDAESPIPPFDAGAALFQLGRFLEARARYRAARSRTAPDSTLRAKVDYALGNAAAASGDDPAAIGHYDDCLASKADGPEALATRADAEINRRFVLDRLQAPPGSAGTPREPPNPGDDGTPEGGDSGEAGGGDGSLNDDGSPTNPTGDPNSETSKGSGASTGGNSAADGSADDSPSSEDPEARLSDSISAIRQAKDRRRQPGPPASRPPSGEPDW